MRRGVVLVAHNGGSTDYYSMAVYTAKRVNRFLDLPVTLITDRHTLSSTPKKDYQFDLQITIEADRSNHRGKSTWINKGRHQVYDLSPYDETLVLDTDYMVNSTRLLETFNQPSDFVCYTDSHYLLEDVPNEQLSKNSLSTAWATVMRFTKTNRTRDIFRMMRMVEGNYEHYSELHGFMPYTYRNDYALTIAMRTVNGHLDNPTDSITGRLLHAGNNVTVDRVDDTCYNIFRDITLNGRTRQQYIQLSNLDFHMLSKSNFMRLINE